ncbi:MAG TPA: multicopper oxidase domain-containing protein [Terriglobales bacterium]|nr:multicopper oxidase domain-containing protein [Terriglobales bacterium]
MRAQVALAICSLTFLSLPLSAATRHYYIAAEDVTWNFAPSGRNLLDGDPVPQPWAPKLEWPKTRFIQYTDDAFSVRVPQPEWLGILGPIIRGEVGDEIVVDFLNRSRLAHDMHPHGLRYDKNNEGSLYLPVAKGAVVPPGGRYTYHWFASAASGPQRGTLSSKVWWYHSHIDPGVEINAGLLGPIIITAKGMADAAGKPKDVDREFVTAFMIFDQKGGKPDGLYYAINGYIFGNLPGLMMKQGEKVRWYLLGMGNEIDLHTPHWHGETVSNGRDTTDVVELLPGSMKTVDMIADNPGSWMFHCHVQDHMENGMMAVYTIYAPPTRACPAQFTAGDFWQHPESFSLTVKNTSSKKIMSMSIVTEMFLAPLDLRRAFNFEWSLDHPIAPGEEETLQKPGIRASSAQSVLGWVFYPYSIKFEDGSRWRAENEGECFQVFWRDKEHPEMPALPPRQIEMNPD